MENSKALDIQDADNIDLIGAELEADSDDENQNQDENSTIQENNASDAGDASNASNAKEPNELGDLDEPSILYNILHVLDDIYVYGRTVIENNYINLSDNADFNLVYPNIYIGNYSTSTNLELLQGLGITHIITVLPTFNPPFPDKFTYLHIQAYDDETQNLEPFFQKTNQFIGDAMQQRGKLLIHCMVGRSRSVSIFIGFLIYIIQGYFNQSLVDITSDITGNIDANNARKHHMIDSVISSRDQDKTRLGNNINKDTEISRLEYVKPEFNNKVNLLMSYKKDTMIREIERLIEKYKMYVDTSRDNLYTDILEYVQKYRTIACPNSYFEKQLKNLLLRAHSN